MGYRYLVSYLGRILDRCKCDSVIVIQSVYTSIALVPVCFSFQSELLPLVKPYYYLFGFNCH